MTVCALAQGVGLQFPEGCLSVQGRAPRLPHPKGEHSRWPKANTGKDRRHRRQRERSKVSKTKRAGIGREGEKWSEKKKKRKDWNKEPRKVRPLLLWRLEFLTWLLLNRHPCYHHGQEARV